MQLSFGIGTRLTHPQVKPLNIVIKLVECNGNWWRKVRQPWQNYLPR
ncbi:hypothetical protein ACLBR5_22255 [Escherichia coli]